jgi:hypothetical protein
VQVKRLYLVQLLTFNLDLVKILTTEELFAPSQQDQLKANHDYKPMPFRNILFIHV